VDEMQKRQTILIVDDAKSNIDILAELLKSDYKIRAATNGQKALDIAFSENPPDLILLDILMPGIDGYEVCRRLKNSAQTKSIPVIFITGKVSEDDEIVGFTIGAVDYITKPFSPVIVKARVNTHAELKRHRDYLEEISYLDGLTGIANRRKFDEYVTFTCGFSRLQEAPVSMIMVDIDHFKHYNDQFGHQEGDTCLRRIALALSDIMTQKTDFIARYGGEEFACILPNRSQKEALIIAEKLRAGVENLRIPHADSEVNPYVTISIGVSTIYPDDTKACIDLIKSADEALYRSKESGRNKVSI
jgi:diguanylate cyclase (GGDEF)-like protein